MYIKKTFYWLVYRQNGSSFSAKPSLNFCAGPDESLPKIEDWRNFRKLHIDRGGRQFEIGKPNTGQHNFHKNNNLPKYLQYLRWYLIKKAPKTFDCQRRKLLCRNFQYCFCNNFGMPLSKTKSQTNSVFVKKNNNNNNNKRSILTD